MFGGWRSEEATENEASLTSTILYKSSPTWITAAIFESLKFQSFLSKPITNALFFQLDIFLKYVALYHYNVVFSSSISRYINFERHRSTSRLFLFLSDFRVCEREIQWKAWKHWIGNCMAESFAVVVHHGKWKTGENKWTNFSLFHSLFSLFKFKAGVGGLVDDGDW